MEKLELNEESLRYLRKAELVLKNHNNSRKAIAERTGIPYQTVRHFVSSPERLMHTKWPLVMLLAQLYDELNKQAE